MSCEEARKLIPGYADGELDLGTSLDVEQHLEECPSCAREYEGRVKNGGILLSVHSDNSEWTKRAKEILERTGAQDISSSGEASADFSKSDRPMRRAS